MPAEQKENLTEQEQDEALLDNMESTLRDMRGDDSYDDVDSPDDTADSIDQRPEETGDDEQTQAAGEEAPAEQEQAEEGESGSDGEEGGDPEAASDGADKPAELSPEEQDAEDDKLMESFTNDRTTERFQQFRDQNKELTTNLEESNAKFEELNQASSTLFDYLDESATSPEQLSAELAINKAINSGDFTQVRDAYERMQQMMAIVATGLGDNASPAPLSDELQAAVDNLDITPDLAQQYAQKEAREQLQGQYQERGQQQQMQQEQVTTAKHQAAADIKAWEKELATNDPDFTGKQQQMLQNAQQIMSQYSPDRWLAALQQEYRVISDTQARLAQQQQRQRAKNPGALRTGGGGPKTHSAQPTSFEDNLNQTLRDMRPDAS